MIVGILTWFSFKKVKENKGVFFSTHITSDLDKIADYITFINNGEIVLSDTKDYILENYAVIKGKKEILSEAEAKLLIGVRQNKFGFEALAKDSKQVKRKFGDKVLIDSPTLEDIMLIHVDQEKGVI